MSDSDYEWLTEMGLCHKCRKNKMAPDHKFCFDCLEKIRKENAMRYDPKRAREYQARRREIYRQKKEAGICIRCSRPATQGLYCLECTVKRKRRQEERARKAKDERHNRGLVSNQRKEDGLCLWCGKPAVPGKQCCEEHQKVFSDAGKKAAAKDTEVKNYWKLKKSKSLSGT